MSKKKLWWLIGILLSPVLLFVVLVILLYLPPVQNWAVDKVAEIASEKTGMQISVGHVNLSFPLDLVLDDFKMVKDTDTIADVRQLVADVQLWPLLKKKVVINQLEVSDTRLNTNGFVEAARVKGDFKRLFVRSRGIDLDRQTVEVNGARLEEAHLDIALNDSVPEDTTKTETLWKIMADSVAVVHSDVALHLPGDTMSIAAHLGSLVARQADIDLGAETYTVASVDWTGGALRYDQNFEPFTEGLDYHHLDLTNVHVGIDSIYYHDPTLRLHLRQLALKEKSGLELTNVSGPVAMENGSIRLPKFQLTTPNSTVYVALDMPLSLTDSIDPGKMRLMVDAQLGRQDLMPFMNGLPEGLRSQWPYYPLTVKGQLKGNLDYMEFSELDLSLPTVFHLDADGFIANVNDMQRLRADVQFKGQTQNLNMVTALLPHDVQRQFRIPAGISAEGRVKADGSQYFADVTAREGGGEVKVKGNFNAARMAYDAQLSVNKLNLHHFMPHDSLYTVTADITAKGSGTDLFSPSTVLNADATISQLTYGAWNIHDVTAQADVSSGRARATIVSHNDLLEGTLHVDGLMQKTRVDATVVADVARIDLYKMRLLDRPLAIGVCGHVDLSSDLKYTHTVSSLFNDLTLRDSARTYRPADIGLLVKTRQDTTYVRAQSGDFIVKLDVSGNYENLLKQLTTLGDSALAQFEEKVIDQKALRRLLPTMKLHVESRSNNPIVTFLKSSGDISIQDLLFDVTSSPESGLNGQGYVHSLMLDDTRLDTITFRITQRPEFLSFGGQVRNNKKNPQFVFNALFDGVLQQRGATLGVRYFDKDNKLGARLGVQAEMVDSGINLHLVPERPTLGYKEFNLNKDNYILLGHNKKMEAKIDLIADDGTGVKIYSTDSDPTALQDITISLNRFNLAEVTSVIPYAPRMSGLMDGDFHVLLDADSHISVVSDIQVQKMFYEHSPLGNISTMPSRPV